MYLTQRPFYKNISEKFFLHFGARKFYTIIFQEILFSYLVARKNRTSLVTCLTINQLHFGIHVYTNFILL